MFELDPKRREAILGFCFARLKEEGGFGASPYLPPTIEDTYFAVKILNLLKASFPAEGTILFLRQKAKAPLPPRLAFFLKETLSLLGFPFAPQVLLPRAPKLDEGFYLKLLGHPLEKVPALSPRPTLEELFFYAYLAPEQARNYLPYVLRAQNPDGGFGFYPGTTSFLENAYYALKFLRVFKTQVKKPEALRDYVIACWRREGFARSPGGIPFLEATYQALEILSLLG